MEVKEKPADRDLEGAAQGDLFISVFYGTQLIGRKTKTTKMSLLSLLGPNFFLSRTHMALNINTVHFCVIVE